MFLYPENFILRIEWIENNFVKTLLEFASNDNIPKRIQLVSNTIISDLVKKIKSYLTDPSIKGLENNRDKGIILYFSYL